MLRRNADGSMERRQDDGSWVRLSPIECAEIEMKDVPEGTEVEAESTVAVVDIEQDVPEVGDVFAGLETEINGHANAEAQERVIAAEAESTVEVLSSGMVDEIPGLVSGGKKGSSKIRERLSGAARRLRGGEGGGRKPQRKPRRIEVPKSAAIVTGPAATEGTRDRQKQKPGAAPGVQRVVVKAPPALMAGRPKWMADLFEAHFRSTVTLKMRQEHNRMKISRQDYAIGWLTLMELARRDPSILRLKGE